MPEVIPYATPNPQIKKDDLHFVNVIAVCHYIWGVVLAYTGLMIWIGDGADLKGLGALELTIPVYGFLCVCSGCFTHVRRFRLFSLVIASFTCVWIPIGTILGISTIVCLQRPGIRASYGDIRL